ncbi:MAG: UDP-N-acetylmuramoyl-L-alanyl-D-glutamate--2,6-diaminopimelate ligase, partial [Armatimonadota bacterium]|nr:UDP-N-acetylmuramoyl-L-alanyl-D-glutamate--2,6-diaminopimelate ligase [Armatimonadota bacterium]
MRLQHVLEGVEVQRHTGPLAVEVNAITYDSRKVSPGALFVCIRGFTLDAHRFIPDALTRGAAAVVVEDPGALRQNPPVPFILVADSRRALARLSRNFYQAPSRKLRLVGVTGTNGKTTTTYMVRHALQASGRHTGVIGTLGALIGQQPIPLSRTTPEAPDLDHLLSQMVAKGVEVCAMEVSSHALALHRVRELEFDVGILSNISQDHLDFHASLEEYRAVKLQLFRDLPARSSKPFVGVVNLDDPSAPWFLEATRGHTLTYGQHHDAQVRAVDVEASARGISYRCVGPDGKAPVRLEVGGLFNVYNSLAAIAAGLALGEKLQTMAQALASFPGVPGRFERVPSDKDFTVVVDYAHTPDGLENVLNSARALKPRKVLVVFGCGGDRDRGKRPKMGAIAARLADWVVVTSDNPRSEEPEAIIQEILAGIPAEARGRVLSVPDRRAAIY